MALVFECLSFGGYVMAVPHGLRAGPDADRLARELRDHDGRRGRDAPVRRGRRGRRRAHRLGAAALGDGGAASWPAGWSPSCRCSTPSTWARSWSSGLASTWASSTAPAPFAITVVPAFFALLLIGIFLAMSLLPGDAERRITGWSEGTGRGARIMAKVVTIPASVAAGVRDGDRPRARPRVGRARRRRLVGLRHRHAVGVLPRLRTRPAALRRHRASPTSSGCWPTCCRCRAASAGSTAA